VTPVRHSRPVAGAGNYANLSPMDDLYRFLRMVGVPNAIHTCFAGVKTASDESIPFIDALEIGLPAAVRNDASVADYVKSEREIADLAKFLSPDNADPSTSREHALRTAVLHKMLERERRAKDEAEDRIRHLERQARFDVERERRAKDEAEDRIRHLERQPSRVGVDRPELLAGRTRDRAWVAIPAWTQWLDYGCSFPGGRNFQTGRFTLAIKQASAQRTALRIALIARDASENDGDGAKSVREKWFEFEERFNVLAFDVAHLDVLAGSGRLDAITELVIGGGHAPDIELFVLYSAAPGVSEIVSLTRR
jgi:hypothetical protein